MTTNAQHATVQNDGQNNDFLHYTSSAGGVAGSMLTAAAVLNMPKASEALSV